MRHPWVFGLLISFQILLGSEAFADVLQSEIPETPSLKTPLLLSVFTEMPSHSVLISTDAGRGNLEKLDQRVQYNPTFGPNVGMSASYGLWSLSLSKRLSFISAQDQQKYGKTQFDDWRLAFNVTSNLKFETYYQNYHGFYADLNGREGMQFSYVEGEAPASDPDYVAPTTSNIVSRPDISALNFGLRATYSVPLMPLFREFASSDELPMMNWDFDFLTKVYYNHTRVGGSEALVPSVASGAFTQVSSLREYTNNTLGAGMGLGVTVPVSPTFSAGISMLYGAGFQRQTNIFSDHEVSASALAEEMNVSIYMDWKRPKDGFRLELYVDSFSSKVNDIHFDSASVGLNFVYYFDGILI